MKLTLFIIFIYSLSVCKLNFFNMPLKTNCHIPHYNKNPHITPLLKPSTVTLLIFAAKYIFKTSGHNAHILVTVIFNKCNNVICELIVIRPMKIMLRIFKSYLLAVLRPCRKLRFYLFPLTSTI